MTQYTKEFKEQAILLPDEIGVKKQQPRILIKNKPHKLFSMQFPTDCVDTRHSQLHL